MPQLVKVFPTKFFNSLIHQSTRIPPFPPQFCTIWCITKGWVKEAQATTYADLDGDKVGLAFVGNGLCQQRLTAARRPVEQHPLAGSHSKLQELFRVLHRILKERKEINQNWNAVAFFGLRSLKGEYRSSSSQPALAPAAPS